MANFSKLIPFIILWETGVASPGASGDKLFELARRRGYANDPADRGGATQTGVTLATFGEWCKQHGQPMPTIKDLRSISYSEWYDILKHKFWDRCCGDEIKSQSVAEMIVDWGWHSGTGGLQAVQRVLCVTPDGVFGPQTLRAINSSKPEVLFPALRAARLRYVQAIVARNPTQKKWLNGWEKRIKSITFVG